MISFPNITQINKKEISNSLDIAELTTIIDDANAITALAVTATKVDLKIGDRIMINGQAFQIAADSSAGARALTITSITPSIPLTIGDKISIDKENLFVQYQRKTEGSVGGMPVNANSIGKYSITGGNYYVVGVDTLYVKILPRDFMVNDDASSPDITPAIFGDGTNTGVSVENTAQELIATVNIPTGTTATEVYVWGSNTTKSVEVYQMNINANGKGSTIGTGVTDGAAISIGTIASSDTNYLMIKVLVSSTNHRIWGGKVTLTQN